MNLIVVIFIALGILVGIDIWKAHRRLTISQQWKGYKTMKYRLQGKNYTLLVADTEQKHTQGLMNVKKLEGVDGMIFIFPSKGDRTFWNENTHMDLDVYWLDDKKVVGQDFLPSIDRNNSIVVVAAPSKVNVVIEIPRAR